MSSIYARENGQGMAFEVSKMPARDEAPANLTALRAEANPAAHPPTLSSVPSATAEDQSDDSLPPEPPKKGGKPFLTRIK